MISWALEQVQARALFASGFNRRTIATSVGNTSVWEFSGDGALPPLLVQHGISSQGSEMARLLLRLRKYFSRVIAPDFYGHGFSDRPEEGATADQVRDAYIDTLRAVIDEPVLFYGNSLGGLAGLRFALTEPSRLCGLMMCSPGGAGDQSEQELSDFLKQFEMTGFNDARVFLNKIHAKPTWYAPIMAPSIYWRLKSPTVQRLLSEVSPDTLVCAEDLKRVETPIALLWGRNESLMPASHREFYMRNLPSHGVVIEPEGFGHCPHIDQPTALTHVIVRWAESLSSSTHHQ